ncbi:MAG: hypothetical protein QXL91_00670 [Candidatus Bathyarchaeia archaeon]
MSIDTFFACALMVLLVLSAMTATAKILQPLINTQAKIETSQRFGEVAKRILLYTGKPANWGLDGQIVPEEFGLAEAGASSPYALDIDKVSRLNSENLYCLSYSQIFTSLKSPDISFRIEIKPIFNVKLNLTAVIQDSDKMIYTFEAATEKDDGLAVFTNLKVFVLAESLLQTYTFQNACGRASFNVTVPISLESPALLVVFAKSTYNNRVVSYGVYSIAGRGEPPSKGTFLKLSPINNTLTVTPTSSEAILTSAYAITFNDAWRLTQTGSNTFSIPESIDESPTVLIVFGLNATQNFVEWTAYPQIPVQVGVDFVSLLSTTNVYAFEHLVSIGYGIYKCIIFIGGPKT